MEDKAKCGTELFWHNCYSGGFALWSETSYSHPAKMSPALCYRILQHLQELGLIKAGDTILDPMAGIGTTNVCAGAMGFKSISVELEEKFVNLQKENKGYAERKLYKPLDWEMIKGDSRRLSDLLKGQGLKSVVSPPYGEALSGGGIAQYGHYSDPDLAKRIYSAENANPEERSNIEKQIERVKQGRAKMKRPDVFTSEGNKAAKGYFEGNYSRNPENIGNLKDTPLKSIVSPPYGETGVGDWKTGRAEFQAWVINEIKTKGYVEWQGKRYTEVEWRAINHGRIDGRTTKGVHKHLTDGYSDNPDNIGGLPDKPLKSVMSPPYSDVMGKQSHEGTGASGKGKLSSDIHYSDNPDNIGQLPDNPLKSIVSPPYGDAEKRDRSKEASNEKEKVYPRGDHNISAGYQGSDDNIGVLADKPLKAITSPPWVVQSGGMKGTGFDDQALLNKHKGGISKGLSQTEGQIQNLPDKPLKSVMSPPYEDAKGDKHHSPRADVLSEEKGMYETYTERGAENVGNEKGESYLSAMSKVYREISLVSDVLCVVVKCPTRDGKLRRLDLDTIAILEASNWRVFCQHRALLFEELEQADMFEGSKKQVKGRLSFFKRLSWQNGQPVANFEDIIIAVRK